MGFFNNFPYTNFHELNLDYILGEIQKLKEFVVNYTAINNVSYAGVWDIKKQYTRWSIVTNDDSSYMSKQPVPAGIAIDNEEYWIKLADLDPRIAAIVNRIEGYGFPASVKEYGAKGDGITDDYEYIQNAVNSNRIVYFPEGVYCISKTIKLRGGEYVFGVGNKSIIKRLNSLTGNMIESVNWELDHGTDNHDCVVENIRIDNIALDGSYSEGCSSGNGICIYGGGTIMENVNIYNQPENGLWTEYNSYQNTIPELGNEGYFNNVRIKNCGKTGWIFNGPHDSDISNCIVGTNSRISHGAYNNFTAGEKGSAKVVNSHFYCDYGAIKPKYSLEITDNSYSWYFSNCHIEGAVIPCYVGSNANVFTSCVFYASFGKYDVVLKGQRPIFSNCEFKYGSVDPVPTVKEDFVSAFHFENGSKNNYVQGLLTNCKCFDNDLGLEFSIFDMTGYNSWGDGTIYPLTNNLPSNLSCTLRARGDFGVQSTYDFVNGYYYHTGTYSNVYSLFGDVSMTGDMDVYAQHMLVNSWTDGNLKLPTVEQGYLVSIHNFSDKNVPIVSKDGANINFEDKVWCAPKTTTTFLRMNDMWRSSNALPKNTPQVGAETV